MPRRNSQRGMTFWYLMFTLAVLGFFLFLGFKLFPPYLDDFKVKSAVDSLVQQPDVGGLSKAVMAESLRKRLDVDNVSHIDPAKYLAIEPRGRNKLIRFNYQVTVPIMFNASVLLDFEHAREVRAVE